MRLKIKAKWIVPWTIPVVIAIIAFVSLIYQPVDATGEFWCQYDNPEGMWYTVSAKKYPDGCPGWVSPTPAPTRTSEPNPTPSPTPTPMPTPTPTTQEPTPISTPEPTPTSTSTPTPTQQEPVMKSTPPQASTPTPAPRTELPASPKPEKSRVTEPVVQDKDWPHWRGDLIASCPWCNLYVVTSNNNVKGSLVVRVFNHNDATDGSVYVDHLREVGEYIRATDSGDTYRIVVRNRELSAQYIAPDDPVIYKIDWSTVVPESFHDGIINCILERIG